MLTDYSAYREFFDAPLAYTGGYCCCNQSPLNELLVCIAGLRYEGFLLLPVRQSLARQVCRLSERR